MRKIIIPTILIATIMIAAGFAVMPVEKAASVHTTIQANQNTPFTVVDTRTTAPGAEVRDFTLDCVNDCIVTSIIVRSTGAGMTTTNIASISNMEVDGVELRADLAAPANDLRAFVIANTAATTDMDEALEAAFTGQVAQTGMDLVTSATESQPTDALKVFRLINGGIGNGGGIGPNPAGTRDVVVEVNFSTDATTATTVTVTWSGFIVGTTEPTAANSVG